MITLTQRTPQENPIRAIKPAFLKPIAIRLSLPMSFFRSTFSPKALRACAAALALALTPAAFAQNSEPLAPRAAAPSAPAQTPAQPPAPAPAPAAPKNSDAVAQSAGSPFSNTEAIAKLDTVRAQLDSVTAGLRRANLDDAALLALRTQLNAPAVAAQAVIDDLTPKIDPLKARLDQLGPKPDDKAPPESASVTEDRNQQLSHLAETEDTLKRAKLLSVQIEQAGATIAARRRALFTTALFQRAYSILSPSLWIDAARESRGDAKALRFVTSEYAAQWASRLKGASFGAFLASLVGLALAGYAIAVVVRRILSREPTVEEPSPLMKALGAAWIAIVIAVGPLALVVILTALMETFDLSNARLAPLGHALAGAVARIAVTAGLARALLAPTRPLWRLAPFSDAVAARLSRLALIVAVIVSLGKIVDSLNEIVNASLPVTAATQGVTALLVVIAMAVELFRLGEMEEADDELGPRVDAAARWIAPLRLIVWALIAIILLAILSGFIPFAAFLVDQIVWVAAVLAGLAILSPLLTETIEQGLNPKARIGRSLMLGVGVARGGVEQAAILLSGFVRVVLYALALGLIIAPWGVQSDDLASGLRSAYFGFKIGDVTISPASILIALALFAAVYTATRALQSWIVNKYLPATHLDPGLSNSISTSIGYLGFVAAVSLALAHVGLSLEKLAIVAGALSVGIGFGLQSIVNNFVSGLILLWERAIRVGDWVVIGDDQGFVRKINVRSTEIETFDRSTMIVPNSNLVTGVVKNWMRSDKVGRVKIPISINTSADPQAMREILIEAARANEEVARIPAPQAMFVDMDPNALKFELLCFVDEVERIGRVRSDLRYDIFARMKAAGIALSSPTAISVTLTPAGDGASPINVARGSSDELS
ncbi:MAG: mechanosensitive ion channel family protein [Hyphomicrobiales bacterium]|nr:mechanosensitive ion channel family protein [Hyphomicrobiales bacterium]